MVQIKPKSNNLMLGDDQREEIAFRKCFMAIDPTSAS